jgi:hypothetical protein
MDTCRYLYHQDPNPSVTFQRIEAPKILRFDFNSIFQRLLLSIQMVSTGDADDPFGIGC